MKTVMDRLQVEDDKLNLELEESHGDYEKMRLIFEKRIDLYKRFLRAESLTELDRFRLENKREWTMSHLLNLIIEKELCVRITDLTKRVYRLEKADGLAYNGAALVTLSYTHYSSDVVIILMLNRVFNNGPLLRG
jgi:hypothetical protein